MVTEPTCIHGLVLRWCSQCRRPQPAPKEPIETTYSVKVGEGLVCVLCERPIAGGEIAHRLMPSGEAIHEYCW